MAALLAISPAQGIEARGNAGATATWARFTDARFDPIASDAKINTLDVPRAVTQDGTGFIWIATDGGLVRWDGHSFHTLAAQAGDAGSLPENLVGTTHTDSRGRLWVGLLSDGLRRYDPTTGQFFSPANATALDHGTVVEMTDDGAGGLWVASQHGLGHVDGRTLRVTMVPTGSGLPPHAVDAVARDATGTLWVLVGDQLFRRAADEGRFHVIAIPLRAQDKNANGRSLFSDRPGRVWLSTSAGDLYVVDHNRVQRLTIDPPRRPRPPRLGKIIQARPGVLWVASDDGILTVDTWSLGTQRMRHDPANRHTVPEDQIIDLFRDRAGQIWVVGEQTLSRIDPVARGVAILADMLGRNRQGEALDPRAISIDVRGRLWIGTKNDGGFVVDPQDGRPVPLVAGTGLRGMPPAALRIRSFANAGEEMYLGTDTGLFAATLDGRIRRRISSAPIDRLLIDGRQLLVAERTQILTLDLDARPAVLRAAPFALQAGGTAIRALKVAPDGALWVGTAHGLYRFDRRTSKVSFFAAGLSGPHALGADFVATLLFDRAGNLWVGTGGGGIDVLRAGRSGWSVVRRLDKHDGLPNLTIDALLQSVDGAIWAATDGGITRIDPRSFDVRTLSAADGLAFTQYWTGIGVVARDGELLFGGVGAITAIDPRRAIRGIETAPLVITEIKVDGARLPVTNLLVLSSSTGTISIDFTLLDYAAADRIDYAYRLKGQGDHWIHVDSDHRTAAFDNLPPGRYTLQIRSTDRYGRWPRTMRTLEITITPRWFEAWWFYLILAVAAVAALVLATRLWTMGLRRAKAALERLVATRTEELRLSKNELERLVYFDPLTGLGNRRMFVENMNRLTSGNAREQFSLILVDLDRFKTINDTLGHDAGDAMLGETAVRLLGAVRQTDSVARLGGDEFAIILPGLTEPDAIAILCDRIIGMFIEDFTFAGQPLRTSPSLGVATFPDHAADRDGLYKAADLALYAAKHAGRNTFRFADCVVVSPLVV